MIRVGKLRSRLGNVWVVEVIDYLFDHLEFYSVWIF